MSNFTFDKATHTYKLDGKRLTGVTTILNVVAKPALIQWAADQACDHINEYSWSAEAMDGDLVKLREIIEEARKAHTKTRDKAAEQGTDVHAKIEEIVNVAIKDGGHIDPMYAGISQDKQITYFIHWAIENKVKFLSSEVKVYSEKYWYAGTFDLLYERDGRIYIGDIKTSNRIYWTHFLQMAGYHIAIEEIRPDNKVDGYEVIHLPKKGKLQTRAATELDDHRTAFLAALDLYRNQCKYEKLFSF